MPTRIRHTCRSCGRTEWVIDAIPTCVICGVSICDSCKVVDFCKKCAAKLKKSEIKEYSFARSKVSASSSFCSILMIVIGIFLCFLAVMLWSPGMIVAGIVLIVLDDLRIYDLKFNRWRIAKTKYRWKS